MTRTTCLTAGAFLAFMLSAAHADGERVAILTTNLTNPHFQLVRAGADAAARQMKASVTHYVPSKADSLPEQMSQVEDLVIKKPDAIVFVPADYKAMVPGIEKLNAAGIPLVNVTTRLSGGKVVSFVGSNDYDLGLATGRYLLKALGGKGNVIIIEGLKGNIVSMNRVRGFTDALKEFPNVKLLASQTGNFQRLPANQVMENLLQAHAKVDGVMAANDAMASGVIEALDGAGRKALVVGINGTKEAIDAIRAGKLLATGDYGSFLQGCVATVTALRNLRGLPVRSEVVFPATLIDKSNVDRFDIPTQGRECPTWEALVR
ncbi:MAG: sugar ABC transporter substrate-binding protein [Hyphomicrobiaceae bacterium]|nr:MAG: sugar ABC transporter substrate-binding protein [Hyphomicrobiaceae bacterium]